MLLIFNDFFSYPWRLLAFCQSWIHGLFMFKVLLSRLESIAYHKFV